MLKKSFYALVITSLSLLSVEKDDCIPPKKSLPHETVIKSIRTVEQAENYLTNYLEYSYDIDNYGQRDYVASFKVINERKKDDCDGGALAAAALLSDNGYPPLMLVMRNDPNDGHAAFVYREGSLMGCLGINKTDCIRPRFRSLEEITMYFKFEEYCLINFDAVSPDWKDCDYNLHKKTYRHAEFTKVQ